MAVVSLMDGSVFVTYHQLVIASNDADEVEGPGDEWRGQSNGLCGAGVPGRLLLMTGLHTGVVHVTVESHTSEPELDGSWEDSVEVAFRNSADDLILRGLDGEPHALALPPGSYRARYSAIGLQAGSDIDTLEGDDPVDRYLMQFWPSTSQTSDRVLRTASEAARYWHQIHTNTERTTGESEEDKEWREREKRERWGDRSPNARLWAMEASGAGFLERLDIDFVFALSEATDDTHRQLASWAALRAAEIAGLTEIRELAPAFAALRGAQPAPPPFDDSGYMFSTVANSVPRTLVRRPPDGEEEQVQQDWAAAAILDTTVDGDSLATAYQVMCDAAGAYGMDYRRLFIEARRQFPQL